MLRTKKADRLVAFFTAVMLIAAVCLWGAVEPVQGDGSTPSSFQVAIIPYTFEHTNFCDIRIGSVVNLEFDILGKYIARLQQL